MFFSKQDYEYLLSSLSKKYSLYNFIDSDYLTNMLDNLMINGYFEDLVLARDDMSKDMNPLFHISFKIQNYLYYKICKLCEEDIEVLLCLVEDKRRIINLILRKMKVEDDGKIDDYIMNIASLYNGAESFDSFVTRYVMAMIKGIPFIVEKSVTTNNIQSLEVDNNTKSKKKEKKKKKKNKLKEKPLVDEDKDPLVDNSDSLDFDKEEKLLLSDVIFNKCNSCLGSGSKDNFIEMVLMSDLVNSVNNIEDEKFKLYFLMRYGFMNESFYTREEIANILSVELLTIIEYERFTINKLREFMNKVINHYEDYILRK